MPRPSLTDDQLRKTRARILAETAKIIATGGYAAFSTRALARAVGLTAGALYRYFPTKQHVLIAYWSEALAELHARFVRICENENDPKSRIGGILAAYTDFALEDSNRFRLLFLENDLGLLGEMSRDHDFYAPFHFCRARVAEAVEAKILRPIDPDAAAAILWGAVHGVICISVIAADLGLGDIHALAREAAETTIHGLSAVPGDQLK